MPELPEVETVRRYLQQRVVGATVTRIELQRTDLRYPIPVAAVHAIEGRTISAVRRRAKYLLLCIDSPPADVVLVHLGMSGRLFLDDKPDGWRRHEHYRIGVDGPQFRGVMRYIDARRFGALDAFEAADEPGHKLLASLGIEPFDEGFTGAYLHRRSRGRSIALKKFIMDAKVVTGVGNIYASESLWRAGLSPRKGAGRLTKPQAARLANAIVDVLTEAVDAGGTTLRDFVGGDKSPGYFQQRLDVYGRAGQPCHRCADRTVKAFTMDARSTYWCAGCQKS